MGKNRSKLAARHVGFGVKSERNPKNIIFYDPEGFAEAVFARAPFEDIKEGISNYQGNDQRVKECTLDDLLEAMRVEGGKTPRKTQRRPKKSLFQSCKRKTENLPPTTL